jgi:hypothetical protein
LLAKARIAYQVVGRGPPDLVVSAGTFGNVDWEDPMAARMYRRDASFSRLIRFDRRGSGVPSPKFAWLPVPTARSRGRPSCDSWIWAESGTDGDCRPPLDRLTTACPADEDRDF